MSTDVSEKREDVVDEISLPKFFKVAMHVYDENVVSSFRVFENDFGYLASAGFHKLLFSVILQEKARISHQFFVKFGPVDDLVSRCNGKVTYVLIFLFFMRALYTE